MKTDAEALGAIVGMIVLFLVACLIVAAVLFGTAVLAGLWFRLFLQVAGL